MFKRFIIFLFVAQVSCSGQSDEALADFEQQLNIDTERRIDAAYAEIQQRCDSLMLSSVPAMVDSIIQSGNKP